MKYSKVIIKDKMSQGRSEKFQKSVTYYLNDNLREWLNAMKSGWEFKKLLMQILNIFRNFGP